jgi:hypothetical protein
MQIKGYRDIYHTFSLEFFASLSNTTMLTAELRDSADEFVGGVLPRGETEGILA